jgi:ubiquinone/menaquinone biosynthesis C-methylase UbiE
MDPERRIETAMRELHDWTGGHVLDLGCGTGFHLSRWAEEASLVTGVEPHPGLARIARRRVAGRRLVGARVRVLAGTAQNVPLPDSSVDMTQARWAYFFGPGSEPGLREIERVTRPGGAAFVIDNDPTRSTFGSWFRRGYPHVDPVAVERFWSMRGWTRRPLDVVWRFASRADLEAVVRIELPPALAEQFVVEHRGLEVDYAVNLWWRRYPCGARGRRP